MFKRDEAYKLASEGKSIMKLKSEIEDNIIRAVELGCFGSSIDVSEYSETSRDSAVMWLKNYGYDVTLDPWEDSRSGWTGVTLRISWGKKQED